MAKKYKHIIIGGTFDHFHLGHQKILERAFFLGEKVTIGMTKKDFHKNKFLTSVIEEYDKREKSVRDFLNNKDLDGRFNLIPIVDIFGTTLTDPSIEAILVSQETHKNALLINEKRREKQLPDLEIIVFSYVTSNDGQTITSERIRSGEIDRFGERYISVFDKKEKIILPLRLRDELKKPLGNLLSTKELFDYIRENKPVMVIAVGDIVANLLYKNNFDPELKIIDFKTKRKKIAPEFPINKDIKLINNKAGTITKEAVLVMENLIKKYFFNKQKQILTINGEEDLLALPAILLAPLNSLVLYGQPDEGTIVIKVTEEKKREIKKLVERFD